MYDSHDRWNQTHLSWDQMTHCSKKFNSDVVTRWISCDNSYSYKRFSKYEYYTETKEDGCINFVQFLCRFIDDIMLNGPNEHFDQETISEKYF